MVSLGAAGAHCQAGSFPWVRFAALQPRVLGGSLCDSIVGYLEGRKIVLGVTLSIKTQLRGVESSQRIIGS